MTPKLAALSGFGNQARHRPVRFLLAKILTPRPLRRNLLRDGARRRLCALEAWSTRRGSREGGAGGAEPHQRRRAGLAAAQSPPEPSPGRRERW